jgi:hypothetical protein
MFMVTNTATSGAGSLKQAILDSNGTSGPNAIEFAINSGMQSIPPTFGAPLPAVTTTVVFDGTTQPGYAGTPLIFLDGVGSFFSSPGLDIKANGCTIKGLAIGGYSPDMQLESDSNVIEGDFVGTNATGTGVFQDSPAIQIYGSNNTIGGTTSAARNVVSVPTGTGGAISINPATSSTTNPANNVIDGNYIGIQVSGTATLGGTGSGISTRLDSGTTIGGTTPGAGNVISGCAQGIGILVGGTGELVQGNKIGTNAAGTSAIPNKLGVALTANFSDSTLGGTIAGAGNLISGNGTGMELDGTTYVIEGNRIGTDAAGTTTIANTGDGILIQSVGSSNTVGGTIAAAANVIAGNGGSGIDILSAGSFKPGSNVIQGNKIGTDVSGTIALPNTLDGIDMIGSSGNTIGGTASGTGNVISANGRFGIQIAFNPNNANQASNNVIQGNQIGTDISGTVAIANGLDGIYLNGAANNTIGGTMAGAGNIIASSGQFGIFLQGFPIQSSFQAASNNVIQGNRIGSGTFGGALGNKAGGITMFPGATGNTIGGTVTGEGNTISGNLTGVILSGTGTTGNLIQGNFIGTDAAGTVAAANLDGVLLSGGASGNTIGGTVTGAGNTISGNARFGILLQDAATSGNVILGNHIGVSLSGTAALANGANGVNLNAASGNTIGGTGNGAGNTISGNAFFGILFSGGTPSSNLVEGNVIGTNAAGTAALANGMDGIDLAGAADNTIGGPGTAGNVISGNAAFGVYLTGSGATGNQVLGNLIGTNGGGNAALPNGLYGVLIAEGANSNVIGGPLAGQGNLISGNTDFGVYLLGTGTTGNVLQGNLIGVNLAGTAGLANGVEGIEVLGGASANAIGGTAAGAGNVISGNGRNGILIAQAGSNNNLVRGNFIGTDRSGTLLLGNGYQGIGLVEGAASNTVGGTVSGAANTIAFNTSTGVTVGTSASDTAAVGNAILGNSIDQNGGAQGLGIDLGNNGVTANGSGPSGPNHFQNHPTFSGTPMAANNIVTATISFTSVPSSTFRLEFFLNEVEVISQGTKLLGAVSVTTDTNGNLATATALTAGVTVGSVNTGNNTVSVMLPLPAGVNAGSLTATATLLSVGTGQTASVGDTSEFSAGAAIAAPAQPG